MELVVIKKLLKRAAVEEVDDELDIQIYDGGQPVYPYLISVE